MDEVKKTRINTLLMQYFLKDKNLPLSRDEFLRETAEVGNEAELRQVLQNMRQTNEWLEKLLEESFSGESIVDKIAASSAELLKKEE